VLEVSLVRGPLRLKISCHFLCIPPSFQVV
jgi:hypothetical protein